MIIIVPCRDTSRIRFTPQIYFKLTPIGALAGIQYRGSFSFHKTRKFAARRLCSTRNRRIGKVLQKKRNGTSPVLLAVACDRRELERIRSWKLRLPVHLLLPTHHSASFFYYQKNERKHSWQVAISKFPSKL